MKTLLALLMFTLFAGCTTQAERQQQIERDVQAVVARCNFLGYYGYEERRCVVGILEQRQRQSAAEFNALVEQQRQSQPVQTNCRPDGLGGTRCTTRQSPGALILP